MSAALYDKIVSVVEVYLGPAAPRFVDRQISSHTNKSPKDVSAEDLDKLTDWIKISMSLLTDDRSTVDECVKQLVRLR